MAGRLTVPPPRLNGLRDAFGALDSPAFGRAAFAAFLLVLLGYGGFLAYYTLVSFDVVNLHRDGMEDDALYYLEIARNLAAGKFSTFDGGITRTNGYHPLWLLLITPLYWLFDADSALFGIKALEIMLIAAGVCLMAVAVRSARLPWILLLVVPPALYAQHGMLVGMEAAAGLFMLGAFLVGGVLHAGDAKRWRHGFAALAFLLPWVRLEYGGIALFVTGVLYLLPAVAEDEGKRLRCFSAAKLRTEGLPALAAIGGLLAYFLYNGVVFGGIVPVSGAQKLAWSREWFSNEHGSSVAPLSAAYEQFVATAATDLITVVELSVYVALALLIGGACGWQRHCRALFALLVFVLALGLETLAHQAQVAVFYHPDVRKSTSWYYVPGYLMAALILPVRCYVAIVVLRLAARRGFAWMARPAVPVVCVAGIGIYATLDPYAVTEPFRFVDARSNSHRLDDVWAPALGGLQLDAMLPKDAVVGSWDSGEVGYFTQLPVVNLDGLVNSYEYLRRGGDAWDLWLKHGGVPEFGVTHLINHVTDDLVRGESAPEFEYVGHRVYLENVWSMKLWPVAAHVGSVRPWTEIVAPSQGADGGGNGYFELRRGRQLQLFVADCNAGPGSNVPEMVRFSWRDELGDRATTRLWTRPVRTELGYCTATFLLPHGAGAAARIAVDAASFDSFVAGVAPLLRSPYEVYAVGNQLGFSKRECGGTAGAYFFLHVRPGTRRDLPPDRRQHGFDNYDHAVNWLRRETAERCLAVVELPGYAIDEVWTGELKGDTRIWQSRLDGLALRPQTVQEFLDGAEHIVHADYDVYVDESRDKLLYAESIASAAQACPAAYVSLHVHPRRPADLPEWQRQYGFANLDFELGQVGFVSQGRCVAAVPLPDFEISHLNIGKSGAGHWTWHAR